MRPPHWRRMEKWKHIKGFGKMYSVSNMGRIRANRCRRPALEPGQQNYTQKRHYLCLVNTRGHAMVKLRDKNRKIHNRSVRVLVAQHFLPPNPGRVELRNPELWDDCSVHNLRWKNKKVSNYPHAKLTKKQVREIKETLAENWGVWGIKSRLAEKFNVSLAFITYLAQGKRHAEVPPTLPPKEEDHDPNAD